MLSLVRGQDAPVSFCAKFEQGLDKGTGTSCPCPMCWDSLCMARTFLFLSAQRFCFPAFSIRELNAFTDFVTLQRGPEMDISNYTYHFTLYYCITYNT